MDPITPSVIALHGALVEVTLRLARVEKRLHMPHEPRGTVYQRPYEPCSCEESLALRARVRQLETQLRLLDEVTP